MNQTANRPALATASLPHSLVQAVNSIDIDDYPSVTLAQAVDARDQLSNAMHPVEKNELHAAMAHTLLLWKPPENLSDTVGFYVEALENFPASVVSAAIKHVRQTHRYPTAPTPADFHAAADREMGPLYRARNRIDVLITRLRPIQKSPPPPPIAAPRAPVAKPRGLAHPDSDIVNLGDWQARKAMWEREAAKLGIADAASPTCEDGQ